MPEPVHEIVIQTIGAYFLWLSSFFFSVLIAVIEYASLYIDRGLDSVYSEEDIANATQIVKARANLVCGICLENVNEDAEVKEMIACGHQFHSGCIDHWLVRRAICPYCREPAFPQ